MSIIPGSLWKKLRDVRLKKEESIISYDVTALFTSVPIPHVLKIIEEKLANDKDLQQRTNMPIKLWEFCLRSTYFVFQGQYYEQVEGAAIGSPLSPIVAYIFMENFEAKALQTAPHPTSLWKRFVGDTFVILETEHKEVFFNHINAIEEKIQFTAETTRADESIPFLDTILTPKSDESLSTSIYRKPTHTNQYLQWDSHHGIANKYSVIKSLLHRAEDICSNQDQLEEEQTHIDRLLSACKYPSWVIKRMKLKNSTPRTAKYNNKGNRSNTINKSSITVPYNKGLSESFKTFARNMAFKFTSRVERP